jgi:branched-chain amino acid transport system permease protein
MRVSRSTILCVLAVVVLFLIPFNVSDYQLSLFATVALTTVALLGLNLLTGYGGQTSLGHGAFYAIGAYTTAILVTDAHMPHLWTLPIATVVSFAVGLLIGIPAVRLRGTSLALVTLALAIALPQLLKHFESVTGGQLGVSVPRPSGVAGLTTDQWVYLVTVVVALLALLGTRNLVIGRIGLSLVSIRDNDTAAGAMGIPVNRTRIFVFALSAALTGLAGALATLVTGYVSPDNFGLLLSINLVAGIVLGGLGTISGAVIGAVFLTYLPLYTTDISETAPGIVNGLIIIAFMLLLPDGVAGLIRRSTQRLWSRLRPERIDVGNPSPPRSYEEISQ